MGVYSLQIQIIVFFIYNDILFYKSNFVGITHGYFPYGKLAKTKLVGS